MPHFIVYFPVCEDVSEIIAFWKSLKCSFLVTFVFHGCLANRSIGSLVWHYKYLKLETFYSLLQHERWLAVRKGFSEEPTEVRYLYEKLTKWQQQKMFLKENDGIKTARCLDFKQGAIINFSNEIISKGGYPVNPSSGSQLVGARTMAKFWICHWLEIGIYHPLGIIFSILCFLCFIVLMSSSVYSTSKHHQCEQHVYSCFSDVAPILWFEHVQHYRRQSCSTLAVYTVYK